MTRIFLFFFALTLLLAEQTFAQRRTTSVKGYYRKDGTYVKPHTRHYNTGSGAYSSGSSGTYSNDNDTTENIQLTTLDVGTIEKTEYTHSTSKYKYEKGAKIAPTTLVTANIDDSLTLTSNTIKPKQERQIDGVVIYVSVLRYNGKTIDVCPITRGYSDDWDFNKIRHRFNKSAITSEEALQLVSEYGWSISGEDLKKDFSYDHILNKGFPKYLTRTIEAMKLK
jgi:hypothetical protein